MPKIPGTRQQRWLESSGDQIVVKQVKDASHELWGETTLMRTIRHLANDPDHVVKIYKDRYLDPGRGSSFLDPSPYDAYGVLDPDPRSRCG